MEAFKGRNLIQNFIYFYYFLVLNHLPHRTSQPTVGKTLYNNLLSLQSNADMVILRLTQTNHGASLISASHTINILMSLSQTGWNHVYKFLFLVTYMGPSSSSRFVHCITSWFTLLHHPVKSLVQHLTSYPSKYTHCLLFVILINIRPSIFLYFGLELSIQLL